MLDPSRRGFTYIGNPGACSRFTHTASGSSTQCARATATSSSTGSPAPRSVVRASRLSMLTAADATSQPQYGMPASSNSPCSVPSSPLEPCTSGIATSKLATERRATSEQAAASIDLEQLAVAGGLRAHRHPRRRRDQSIDVLVALELEQRVAGVPRAGFRDVHGDGDHPIGGHRRHRLLRSDHRHLVLDRAAPEEDADAHALSHVGPPARSYRAR